jgi:hypothetical protein
MVSWSFENSLLVPLSLIMIVLETYLNFVRFTKDLLVTLCYFFVLVAKYEYVLGFSLVPISYQFLVPLLYFHVFRKLLHEIIKSY